MPFGRGTVARPGRDLTIVTWGATVQKSLVAAEQLAAEGCSVEVVDLRTISPWDHDIVCESVQRTGRLVVVHEDTLTAGFGAEVAAWVAEHCFWALDAPVTRVTAPRTPSSPTSRPSSTPSSPRSRTSSPPARALAKV